MKKIIALIAAVSMISSAAVVFADENVPALDAPAEIQDNMEAPVIQGDIMLISGEEETLNPVFVPSYTVNTVTVTEITDTSISTTINTEDAENPENTINYTIIDKTIVLGFAKGDVKSVKDIKKGDKIKVYTDAYSPAPLILPPQYQADVIVVEDDAATMNSIDVDTYLKDESGMLVNAANTLALNIGEEAEVVDRKGNKVDVNDLDKKDLVVIYSISTRSIPAQTNPSKVIVLGENELALAKIEEAKENKNEPEQSPVPEETPVPETSVLDGYEALTNAANIALYPLRAIAEANGFTVEWDGNLKAVMINSGMYSLKIGENSYVKGKMVPEVLSAAPEIINDLTYVPAEFFTEILELK